MSNPYQKPGQSQNYPTGQSDPSTYPSQKMQGQQSGGYPQQGYTSNMPSQSQGYSQQGQGYPSQNYPPPQMQGQQSGGYPQQGYSQQGQGFSPMQGQGQTQYSSQNYPPPQMQGQQSGGYPQQGYSQQGQGKSQGYSQQGQGQSQFPSQNYPPSQMQGQQSGGYPQQGYTSNMPPQSQGYSQQSYSQQGQGYPPMQAQGQAQYPPNVPNPSATGPYGGKFEAQLRGFHLPKKDMLRASDPFFIIRPSKDYSIVQRKEVKEDFSHMNDVFYTSETINNSTDPSWKSFILDANKICGNNLDMPFLIEVYDYDSNGKHDLIGKTTASLRDFQSKKQFTLVGPRKLLSKNAGTLAVDKCIPV